ncbi:putative transcriptional regulator [Mycobacterium avium subsp. avium 2285 (R)]|nr:putative transcriptional regulator [Mycobacterium avium subsp. avium 2285 (R)]
MRARALRRGATVSSAGVLPDWVQPELQIQPAWSASPAEAEQQMERSDELVCLSQQCPHLASAGMLTLGHGQPRALDNQAAAAAAAAAKRPFGLWRATLPPGNDLDLPTMLPLPHPQMRPDYAVQAWLSTEDLDGLTKDVRDGGASLTIEQLSIDEAIVWPQQGRLLESWATKLREARESLRDETTLQGLVESAAADYIARLAQPEFWVEETWRHHFQPAWAAAIAAHIRYRGRRAAMRISREFRSWPVYIRDTDMYYTPGRDETTGAPIDLADTHTRLGRLTVTRRAELTDQTVIAVLLAESNSEVAAALTSALGQDHEPITVDETEPVAESAPTDPTTALRADDATPAQPGAEDNTANDQGETHSPEPQREPAQHPEQNRSTPAQGKSETGGIPAAVLHTDGLWLPDGTCIEIDEPITHVGQVAELAYTHQIGYRLTPKFSEPGQIWITEDACVSFGIDVEAISRRDRAKSLRQLTEGIDFVTLAVAAGWSLGGAGEEPSAQRLGTWTRVYREDKRGVMIALIPGMGSGPDEMPVLAGDPTPAQIARRLKLLADALRFPWKINAGVTAVDMMLQTRTKKWSPQEWKSVVFAPSTTTPPFGIGDVESDFDWSRVPTADERQRRYVHAYDRGGSYVAGIAGLELPIGDPIHHSEGIEFDPKTPGYWLIEIPDESDWRLPYVLNPRGLKFTGPKWVTTPTLERAIELGYQPTILEAWTWPQHGRVLVGWYERFRDASTALDTDDTDAQAARNQAKVIRTHGIGIIGSDEHLKGKTAYSPERRLHVLAKAKANIVYRLHQIGEATGQWPLAVATDTVLYASDDPDPVSAWPGGASTLGRGFGQYKPEGSAVLADHLEYLNGRDYRGKRDLIPAAEWLTTVADKNRSS